MGVYGYFNRPVYDDDTQIRRTWDLEEMRNVAHKFSFLTANNEREKAIADCWVSDPEYAKTASYGMNWGYYVGMDEVKRYYLDPAKVEKFEGDAEVNVTFVDKKEIHEINLEFRNIDSPTDVLSFPLGENGVYDTNPENGAKMLGDVVICAEKAFEQADLYGHSAEREIAYLTVHSVLHLLGYDHVDGGLQKMRMREKEETVLDLLGLSIIKD